jgi:Holliday junction DNA helicase RuvA
MIAMLTGQVRALTLNSAVIDVNGVGMLVQISPRLGSSLTLGATTTLFTTLIVREDSMNLFGFESISDRELFELLQTVSGIGPKVAQSALSVLDAPELIRAIATEKTTILEKIPGLGKKGAARIVLELKDKVGEFSDVPDKNQSLWRDQIELALAGLGFTPKEVERALLATSDLLGSKITEMPVGDILKVALQSRDSKA